MLVSECLTVGQNPWFPVFSDSPSPSPPEHLALAPLLSCFLQLQARILFSLSAFYLVELSPCQPLVLGPEGYHGPLELELWWSIQPRWSPGLSPPFT